MEHGGDVWHRGLTVPRGRFQEVGRFGRKFPHLRSLKSFSGANAAALGAMGGPMDGGGQPDAGTLQAGFTFLGQFIDHDLTLDTTSALEQQNDPQAIRNFRTPAFELDSVYGLGPKVQPHLYERDDKGNIILLITKDGADLERNRNGTALIGDPRNDENMLIAQLHLAFLKFHNAVVKSVGNFEAVQTIVRWHYQWIVLNEFLRRTVGDDAVNTALARQACCHGPDEEAFMPVEFAVAAYRFGHSQVRSGYRFRDDKPGLPIFPANPDAEVGDERSDLRGGLVTPGFTVDWSFFFGNAATVQFSNKIDTKLAGPLLNLPRGVVPEGPNSLAVRNLLRGISFALPAGETIAAYYGITPLTPEQVGSEAHTEGGTPLWFYVLKEAEVLGQGQRLAGVGARIVAEVFVDLLRLDKASFLASDPGWKPTLPSASKGDFLITDLLAIADGRVAV